MVPNGSSRTCGWGRIGWNSGPKQAVKNLLLGTYGVEQWSQTGRQEPVVGDVEGGTVVPNRPSRTCCWGRMGWNSGPKQAVKNLLLGTYGVEQTNSGPKQAVKNLLLGT